MEDYKNEEKFDAKHCAQFLFDIQNLQNDQEKEIHFLQKTKDTLKLFYQRLQSDDPNIIAKELDSFDRIVKIMPPSFDVLLSGPDSCFGNNGIQPLLFHFFSFSSSEVHEKTLISLVDLIHNFPQFGPEFIMNGIIPILQKDIFSDICEIALNAIKLLCNLSIQPSLDVFEKLIQMPLIMNLPLKELGENFYGFEDPEIIKVTLSLIENAIAPEKNRGLCNRGPELFNFLNFTITYILNTPEIAKFKIFLLKNVVELTICIVNANYECSNDHFDFKPSGLEIANRLSEYFYIEEGTSNQNMFFCQKILILLIQCGPSLGVYTIRDFIPLIQSNLTLAIPAATLLEKIFLFDNPDQTVSGNGSQNIYSMLEDSKEELVEVIFKVLPYSSFSLKVKLSGILFQLCGKRIISIDTLIHSRIIEVMTVILESEDYLLLTHAFPSFKDCIQIIIEQNLKEWRRELVENNIPDLLENISKCDDETCAGYAKVCLNMIQSLIE